MAFIGQMKADKQLKTNTLTFKKTIKTMAFYKIQYSKLNKKYYPAAKIVGQVSMKKLAKKLSDRSTVTLSDCYAVLAEIGDVMSDFLASGYSVELTGLGSFRYTIDSSKNGKDTPEEVSAADINGERIRFIPEMTRNSDRTVATRAGIAENVQWTLWGAEDTEADTDDDDASQGGSGGSNDDGNNPL